MVPAFWIEYGRAIGKRRPDIEAFWRNCRVTLTVTSIGLPAPTNRRVIPKTSHLVMSRKASLP